MGEILGIIFIVILLGTWWFVLPIVLPFVFSKKVKRIKQKVLDLYEDGTITREQYIECTDAFPPIISDTIHDSSVARKEEHMKALADAVQVSERSDHNPEPKEQQSLVRESDPQQEEQRSHCEESDPDQKE
ncbi:MAG: hypothetical protein II767_06905, partial [Proteobacteria bacterium]|nr:hypothetical protein [Pseudomonadota bacterium]